MYGISVLFSYRVVSRHSVRSYSSESTKKLLEFLADMPRANSARIAEAQRQRYHITKKSEKYSPSTVYLQVLGSGARGAPNTLYLFTDQKRYLFNCGECTQRLAHEHKVKLSRLDHIFITSKTWRNIGGLPGLSLTLQDVGVPNITLHGPEGLDELYTATRRFVIMKDMHVTMAKCSPSVDFEDNVMSVKYVLLGPHDILLSGQDLKPAAKKSKQDHNIEFEEFFHDNTDYYKPDQRNLDVSQSNHHCKTKNVSSKEKPRPKSVDKESIQKKKTEKVLHELQKKSNCSVAYICTLKKRLGTLDLAKCVELGVKPGPMLGQLKNGQDVVLPDGSLVLSKDVKTPDDPGPVFIVLDVPDLSFLKESEFAAHFDNETNPPENIPALIVHFTPPHVFHHPTYRSFMSMFGPGTRHLILNTQNLCLGSEAVHRTQHKLHLLDPDIFPLLRDVSVPAVWNAHPPVPKTNSPIRLKGLEELKNKIALAQFQNIINLEGSAKGDGHPPAVEDSESVNKLEMLAGRTLTMYHLRPKKQLDRTAEPKLHIQDYIQETMDVDGFVGSLEQFRHLVDSMRYKRCDSKEYPKVVFLGTGSCIPSKTRNTSAIVLHVNEHRSILLDCGEGTFGQLVRFYGPKKVNAFLRTLAAVYISHLHADHHIGLIGVIQARRQAIEELGPKPEGSAPIAPLFLLAPGQIVTWLNLYDNQFEKLKSDYTLIPNQNLMYDHAQHPEVTSAVLAAIGVQAIKTCLVPHCPNAFGVAIEVDDRYKMTYSGDTLPSEELVKIGENSTLLIHEATMEDELAEEARTKMHSTTTQAIEIGKQMNARYTVLTHFSQRYARLPRLNSHILNDNKSVGIAFDNMQITMSDLELLPHMYAPLQLMFAEHCVEMELKAAHRQRERERRASTPSLTTATQRPRQQTNNRRQSACRVAISTHTPFAQYRESHASRLRQEIKGMTVSGTVNKVKVAPRSRSNSASTGSPSSRKASSHASRTPSKERTKKVKQEAAHESKKTSVTLPNLPMRPATARSVSENVSKDTLASIKVTGIVSTGHVVDSKFTTRSKTLSAVGLGHSHFNNDVTDTLNNVKSKSLRYGACKSAGSDSNSTGYGKPLVTQVKRKLTIRRDQAWPISVSVDKFSSIHGSSRCSSIKSSKADNREHSSTNSSAAHDINNSKIPTKSTVSGNKIKASNTSPNVFTDTKIPILKSNIGSRSLRPSISDRQHSNSSKSPTRLPKPSDKSKDMLGVPTVKMKPQNDPRDMKYQDQTKHGTPPGRPKTPQRSPNRSCLLKRTPAPTADKSQTEVAKKPSTPYKDDHPLRKKSKPSINKEPVTHAESRPATRLNPPGHSIRSFKPQLEDIKSSYLLLNETTQDINIKIPNNTEKNETNGNDNAKLKSVIDDELRKEKLREIKNKFSSKRFFDDSKYDKIEGLNWISWK